MMHAVPHGRGLLAIEQAPGKRWTTHRVSKWEEFVHPDGRTCNAYLLFVDHRSSGRRVVFTDKETGEVMFDSDDCYDSGNACHKANCYLEEEHARIHGSNSKGERA